MHKTHQAKFAIGQIVHHHLFDYRGVIVDVDPEFQGSEEWYNIVARSCPPKELPWYRVLVDDALHETYVAERNLEEDNEPQAIHHPLLTHFLGEFKEGRYQAKRPSN